jgi:hypothetical protein
MRDVLRRLFRRRREKAFTLSADEWRKIRLQ